MAVGQLDIYNVIVPTLGQRRATYVVTVDAVGIAIGDVDRHPQGLVIA